MGPYLDLARGVLSSVIGFLTYKATELRGGWAEGMKSLSRVTQLP